MIQGGNDTLGIAHDINAIKKKDGFLSLSISADYTINDDNKVKMFWVTTGASTITVTLPLSANSLDRVLEFFKVDAGAGKITVDAQGSETINGSGTLDVTGQYGTTRLKCDGSNWFIIN